MISLGDRRPAWRRPAGAYQKRLPLRQERLAEIINLAKNFDDPASSPPSLSDGRLPQKAFQSQPVNRAKTPYPGYVLWLGARPDRSSGTDSHHPETLEEPPT